MEKGATGKNEIDELNWGEKKRKEKKKNKTQTYFPPQSSCQAFLCLYALKNLSKTTNQTNKQKPQNKQTPQTKTNTKLRGR